MKRVLEHAQARLAGGRAGEAIALLEAQVKRQPGRFSRRKGRRSARATRDYDGLESARE